MRYALAALLCLACAPVQYGPSEADPGYVIHVTNHHPDAVVVYLEPSGGRLGRLEGSVGEAEYWLSTGRMRTHPHILVCVGNRNPTNRQCYATDPMRGGYTPYQGKPGKVFVTIQHGVGGIVAMLNG